MELPAKKYDLIVIDPPWEIKKIMRKKRQNQISMDYPLMSINEIKNLPIKNIADDFCWIFLWTTQKYIFESKKVLEDWGFKYLVMGAWEKTYGISSGMPLFGFRWNVEFFLVGYCGKKPDIWTKKPLIPLSFSAPNVRHSQKPDIFYSMIEKLGTYRIDMFARKHRLGWDTWGNEVNL